MQTQVHAHQRLAQLRRKSSEKGSVIHARVYMLFSCCELSPDGLGPDNQNGRVYKPGRIRVNRSAAVGNKSNTLDTTQLSEASSFL